MKTITAKRTFAGIAALGAAALVLAGCTADTTEEAVTEEAAVVEAAPAAEGLDFLACAVSDEGNWQDNSFNEAVYDGLALAKTELGVQTADAESAAVEDIAPNLQAMVDEGCDVIFAVGFNGADPVNLAADANPDVSMVTVDGYSAGQENLKVVGYKMNQSSYLAGYLAAAYSTSKIVGTSGGLQIDAVTDFMSGFYFGAKAYEKETGTSVTVLGWDPVAATGDFWDSFTANDPTGKSIAASQLEQGADVLFPVGGDQFGAGTEAIKESGVDAVMIGVDKDIALTSPEYAEYILTSAEKRMGEATFNIIEDYALSGIFSSETYVGDLANAGTDISPFYDFDSKVSQETKDRLAEIKQGIIDGTIDPLS